MKNFVKPGKVLTLTAPTGGVVSGSTYLIGGLVVVATVTAAETVSFEAARIGVFTLAKTTSQTWAEGDELWWNGSTSKFTNVATAGAVPAGYATAVAASSDTTGNVLLVPGPLFAAATVAALAQTIGGTYSQSDVQAISTKVDAILTALKAAGIMAAS